MAEKCPAWSKEPIISDGACGGIRVNEYLICGSWFYACCFHVLAVCYHHLERRLNPEGYMCGLDEHASAAGGGGELYVLRISKPYLTVTHY